MVPSTCYAPNAPGEYDHELELTVDPYSNWAIV